MSSRSGQGTNAPLHGGHGGKSPAVGLDRYPYPTALLDEQGFVVFATDDFPNSPATQDPPVGKSICDWFDAENLALVQSFLEDRKPDNKAPDAKTPQATDNAPQVGFCDAHAGHVQGYSFRFVPLLDTGEGQGSLVLVLPTRHAGLSAPSVAERELQHRKKLRALLEVSRAISSTLERDVILQRIVDRVREVVSVPEVVLFVCEKNGQSLVPVVAKVDDFYDEVMAVRLTVGEGIVGYVAKTGRAEIVNHAEQDSRSIQVPGTPLETSSLLCVPLFIKNELAGVVALTRFGDEGFEPDDLEVVTILAAHCSVAIENSRLYENLRKTVEELQTTQGQLIQSAKLNALGEMAGGVAHDFNNILTAILGRTQLLLQRAEDDKMTDSLRVIERTAMDGARTVRRIQEFTRVRQDQGFDEVDMNEIVLDVVEMTRPSWEYPSRQEGVKISASIDLNCSAPVLGHAADLREVITNLMLNALDAMPAGGVIRLHSSDDGDCVVVSISDSGIGMDEETQSKIFDPFFSTKANNRTGLGLSVAYGVIRRHNGSIEVESTKGEGSTFSIRLPAATRSTSSPSPAKSDMEAGSMRVLCVDDEKPVLEVLGEFLEAFGHEVTQALGGEAGIKTAREFRPDVVFTDLGMPGTNGWAVAEAVKKERPETTVVLVTGWGVQIELDRARTKGIDHILPKPYTLEEVSRLLGQILEDRGEKAA